MTDRTCTIDGCDRPLRARGWCATHHQRWRTTGSTADPVKAPTHCTFPGCTNPHNARGLCYCHRKQQRAGEELRPLTKRELNAGRPCKIDGCETPRLINGMCGKHDRRVKLYGDPHEPPPLSVEDRFLGWVDKTETCWLWTGALNDRGYGGLFRLDDHATSAHRAAWEIFRGPIPDGLEIDHLCRTRRCVNPDHLEPVTHLENIRRAVPFHPQRSKTHCKWGHPYSGDNLFVRKGGRSRECRTCMRERRRRAS